MRFVNGLIGGDPNHLLNSHGHRCKELSELNFQNYILFVGDNAGLKLDMPIEDTFPYITANKSKMDYYNLAVFNGGIDVVKNNLVVWLHRYPSPRAIVISCEFANALLISNNNREYLNIANLDDPIVLDMIDAANKCGFFAGKQYLLNKTIPSVTTIPIYQVVIKDKIKPFDYTTIDIAWDGVDINDISDRLATAITSTIKNARAAV